MQLQRDSKAIEQAGITIVGVSYDSVNVLKSFSEKSKIKYPLLSDLKSQVIKAFGVLNEKASGKQVGVPHPMTVLIGKDGKVKAILEGTVLRRHSTQELLDAAKKFK